MNTLWASVLALVAIAIAVVILFNLVQARQQRARLRALDRTASADPQTAATTAEPTPSPDPDRAGRVEPTFADGPLPSAQPGADPTLDDPDAQRPAEPARDALGPVGDGLGPGHAAPAEADDHGQDTATGQHGAGRPTLDPRLDAIVVIDPAAPVAGDRLVTVAGTARRAGSKPITIEADPGSGQWRAPQPGQAYHRVRIGVLLANRNGALNAMEFSEFSSAVQALAQHIGGQAVLPEMQAVLEHARALDDACMELDAQIGLNIETPGALSPAELAALARHLGLIERGNNRFAAIGEGGEVLFSLALGERANLLTLLLDVPRAPEAQQPWPLMLDCARECAVATGGRLIDDADRPLTDAAAGTVMRQLSMRYRSLEEAGLSAGSVAALRVFN